MNYDKDHDDPRFPSLNTGKPWSTPEESEKAFSDERRLAPLTERIAYGPSFIKNTDGSVRIYAYIGKSVDDFNNYHENGE